MNYADRIKWLEDRSLLEAFELKETDETISFSAGFPSTETYPVKEIKESFNRVLSEYGKEALSYGSTSGDTTLRNIIRERMKDKFGLDYELDEIIITSGSQQGLDMSGMTFVNEGDVVLFEAPSYLGAVNALRAYQAELISIPTDREGMKIDSLKEALDKYGSRVKMIYVNPDFQNPTGRSWSDERREEFMNFVSSYDVAILEDAAYSEISFDNQLQKPLAFYDKKGQVVYIGTFSKIFCPGLRVAWLCTRREIMEKYLVLKNAADLSSSTINQLQMADYLKHHSLDDHIKQISNLYKKRCIAMAKAIDKYFPKEASYVMPKGGLFIWLEMPETKDGRELLKRAMKEKISFILGTSFYPSGKKNNEIRLNFSNLTEEEIDKGMKVLGEITEDYLKE